MNASAHTAAGDGDDPVLAATQALFQAAPHVAALGLQVTAVQWGEVHSALVLQPQHLQHTGQVHAGVISTLADHTAGAAAQSTMPAVPAGAALYSTGVVVTAEMKLSLLRAAKGEHLRCVAKVLKPGRRLVFTEAEVWCTQGEREQLVAKFSATMAVVLPTD